MSVGGKYVTAYLASVNRAPVGFTRIGNLLIDTNPGDGDYTAANFVGGIMSSYDSTGYIIITDTDNAGVVGRSTGDNSGTFSESNQPTFWVSKTKDDAGFLFLVNRLPARSGQTPFTDASVASTWLVSNDYWSTYLAPVLSLDAGNPASYPGTGTVWTDTVGGKIFNLINGPGYDPNNGGKFYFYAAGGQYAICDTSLPSLSNWTVGVWHYYTGNNTGALPCIVTETFVGGNLNYSLGNNTGDFSSGFFNGGWQISGTYSLTPGNWYYIVGTYDGNTNKLYVNNTLVASSNYNYSPLTSGAGIRLMERWDSYDYWDGYLATVDIYDQAIDSTKVTSIWNSTKSRFGL